MSSLKVPSKLLEINIISAQDLPPVSKQLRTYVVAWIHPDNKLTTRVDHHGNTNPTWNYKLLFHIDNDLLYSDTLILTIEIYNMAWLRNTPVGITNVLIKHILPRPSTRSRHKRDPVPQLFALQISRPSGQVQGILNLDVNLVDTSNFSMPLSSEVSMSTVRNHDQVSSIGNGSTICSRDQASRVESVNTTRENADNTSEVTIPVLHRSQSEKTTRSDVLSSRYAGSTSTTSIRLKDLSKSGSTCSYRHEIPSEVAMALKKGGLYSTVGEDFGSSIFENWTEVGEMSSPLSDKVESKCACFKGKYQFIQKKDQKQLLHRRRYSSGAGLFSCLWNAYGIEFTFSCGSKFMKKQRMRLLANNNVPSVKSDESSPNCVGAGSIISSDYQRI